MLAGSCLRVDKCWHPSFSCNSQHEIRRRIKQQVSKPEHEVNLQSRQFFKSRGESKSKSHSFPRWNLLHEFCGPSPTNRRGDLYKSHCLKWPVSSEGCIASDIVVSCSLAVSFRCLQKAALGGVHYSWTAPTERLYAMSSDTTC